MTRMVKMLAVTCVAALALAAVSAAGAQAAPKFTASATGSLSGTQTSNQVFTTSAGASENVTCKKAATSGSIISTEAVEQKVKVAYSECTAATSFGNVSAEVTAAEYNLTANGTVHILSTIVIHVGGLFPCSISVAPQTPTGSVSYASSSGKIQQNSAVTGIVSTSSGLCPHGSTGTYTGGNLVSRVGGGTLAWDAS